MSKVSVRFGVGDGHTRRAATWKCWASRGVGKNDVYLACRELGGALKASLHESGLWHVAFERRFLSANAPAEWGTSRIEEWPRPQDTAPGVTVAHRIVTPSGTVNAPLGPAHRSVVWVPPPPDGKAVETDVVITKANTVTTGWPGRRSMGTRLIGSFVLDNDDTVWFVYHEVQLPATGISVSGSPRFFTGKRREDLTGPGVRAILFGSEPDGSRVMYEAVLGETQSRGTAAPADPIQRT